MKNFLIFLLIGWIIIYILTSIIGLSFEPFKWSDEIRAKFAVIMSLYSVIALIAAVAKHEMDQY